jgi:hypothetical protein
MKKNKEENGVLCLRKSEDLKKTFERALDSSHSQKLIQKKI